MKKNYNEFAANWWANKIQSSETSNIHGLSLFEDILSSRIKQLTSLKGSMVISTYGSGSNLLDEIATYSGLAANIPSGYEMRIMSDLDTGCVRVYNPSGMLVANF